MLGSIGTKLALKKLGLPSDPLSALFTETSEPPREPNKLRKPRPDDADLQNDDGSWTSWMSLKSLPLTVQPWLSPPPPPVNVARVPGIGDAAPQDAQGRLVFPRGRRTMVVFLRCVGCAFAQKTFLNLRTLANRYNGALHCVAVSHSSEQATRKWIDLLGGAWSVQVLIDEDRALYAAWGLGLGNVWYVLNPSTQVQGWKEKGWLSGQVAGAIKAKEERRAETGIQRANNTQPGQGASAAGEDEDEVLTTMGNKWQEAGSFAVDGRGTVIWGGKALKADDVMNLEEGAKLLMI